MRINPLVAILAAALTVACGGGSDPRLDDSLRRDLEEATGAGIELAPRAGGLDAISELERSPAGSRSGGGAIARTPGKVSAPAPARRAPATIARAPAPAPASAPPGEVISSRPRPIEQAPARQGPYTTVGEVIRDAPFPIHP